MESNYIRSEQAIDQLTLPWTDAEFLRVGPRYVPKNGDSSVRALFLDHAWQQGKVIILGQQEGVLGTRHFLQYGIGKLLVDMQIMFPVRSPKKRPYVSYMAKWPQPFVSEAEVISFLFLLA